MLKKALFQEEIAKVRIQDLLSSSMPTSSDISMRSSHFGQVLQRFFLFALQLIKTIAKAAINNTFFIKRRYKTPNETFTFDSRFKI